MELPAVKAFSALGLVLSTFFVSMLPLCCFRQPVSLYDSPDKYNTRKRVISLLSCFAGGVFLGTCLLHLLPDVLEQVNSMVESLNLNSKHPIAEFLFGFGFLTIIVIEQIILNFKDPIPTAENDQQYQSLPATDRNINSNQVHDFQASAGNSQHVVCTYGAMQVVNEPLLPATDRNINSNQVHDFQESMENSQYVVRTYGAMQGVNAASELNISFPLSTNSSNAFHSLLLLSALSFHSIFEGLAIGLQTTVQSDLRILMAVIIHKCIIAFSLGLKLTHSDMKISHVIIGNIFFSLTSPIGILIGMAVINLVKGVTLIVTSSILQGLAAGTFLYVTLFEVLQKEFSSDGDRMFKVLSVIIGYSLVSILVIVLPD